MFGPLELYNRYYLHQKACKTNDMAEKKYDSFRHYALIIEKLKYTFLCFYPFVEAEQWNGCDIQYVYVSTLHQDNGVANFVDWTNEIHH